MKKTSIYPDRSQELADSIRKGRQSIKADVCPYRLCKKGSPGHVL